MCLAVHEFLLTQGLAKTAKASWDAHGLIVIVDMASPAAAESNLPTIIAVATVASPNEVLPPLANATVGADVAGASPLNPKGGKPAASPKSKPGQGTPKKSPAAPKGT